ncbi:hypothetical protein M433DRAFT_7376 [Acidomyces richmondensis BFW]|nr:MAG: hypothetical protein FE78DRAFT_87724 [Acidomyces sp. 'richmondensis']KYG42162.1 hypothetical protein M433DRAFT_7376 [Acidomyces richmondensis BFW]
MNDQDVQGRCHKVRSSQDVRERPSNPVFLSHSTSTISSYLQSNADGKPLCRQKRKRTSPEDQAILEAAYRRDPKPEKAARLALVEQVTLGEKEVQIWFQNRRQSSRRKTRPLLPHEIAQYQMARLSEAPQQSETGASLDESSDPNQNLEIRQETNDQSQSFHPRTSQIQSSGENCVSSAKSLASQDSADLESGCLSTDTRSNCDPSVHNTDASCGQRVGDDPVIPASIGGVPDVSCSQIESWNPQQSQDIQSGLQIANMSQPELNAKSSRKPKKTGSFVRLSMSCNGNASVITKDGSSPSPPRAHSAWVLPTNGSNSITPGTVVDNQMGVTTPNRYLHRSLSGRSRDSRAWEFWCDKYTRTELEEKAEKDLSGSAASAIGLMRSASERRVLGSLPAKRNSILSRPTLNSKRLKLHDKPPQFQASQSSLGKLQGTVSIEDPTKTGLVVKQHGSATSVCIPGNDSDKENWSPSSDDRANNDPQAQATLAGNLNTPGGSRAREIASSGEESRSKKQLIDGVDFETDVEVEAFMRSGRKSTSMSSEEDLDCVQGLLSLSQGNWR